MKQSRLRRTPSQTICLSCVLPVFDYVEIKTTELNYAKAMNFLIDIQKIIIIIMVDNFYLQLLTLPRNPVIDSDHLLSLYLMFFGIKTIEIRKHKPRGVSNSAVGIRNSFKDFIRYGHLTSIVCGSNPETQNIGAILFKN